MSEHSPYIAQLLLVCVCVRKLSLLRKERTYLLYHAITADQICKNLAIEFQISLVDQICRKSR